jgi:hypothetical protein
MPPAKDTEAGGSFDVQAQGFSKPRLLHAIHIKRGYKKRSTDRGLTPREVDL